MRLLIVEDNERLAGFVKTGLCAAGFAADLTGRVEDAWAALATTRYDAMIVDLGLPDGEGLDLIAGMRRGGSSIPVLILTARDGLTDRVRGLNGGADDYLVKPFEMEELIARIKALLRRPGQVLGLLLTAGNLSFDTTAREVQVDGRVVAVSRREMALLELLLRRVGRVVAKSVIEESLYAFDDETSANTVEVLVHRLRRRLQPAGASPAIHTVRGVGYLLTEEAHEARAADA